MSAANAPAGGELLTKRRRSIGGKSQLIMESLRVHRWMLNETCLSSWMPLANSLKQKSATTITRSRRSLRLPNQDMTDLKPPGTISIARNWSELRAR